MRVDCLIIFQDGQVGVCVHQLEAQGYFVGSNDVIPIMQYTGLIGKNGKEIYEGDIIQVPDDYDDYGYMSGEKREVYYRDGGFRLKPKNLNSFERGHWLDDDNRMNIIGNIYESPELMNEQ